MAALGQLWTTGSLAKAYGTSVHAVRYVLLTRRIEPCAVAGAAKVFDDEAHRQVGEALRQIAEARVTNGSAAV